MTARSRATTRSRSARTRRGQRRRALACTAVSVPLSQFGPGALPLSDAIDTLLDNARERIAALGGVAPHAVYGATVEVLAGYSASLDLLVVGSRAYGPFGRLVHGSTSDELARTARRALLVLTRTARSVPAPGSSKDRRQPTPWSSAKHPAATRASHRNPQSRSAPGADGSPAAALEQR